MHIDIDSELSFTDHENKDAELGLGDEVFLPGMFVQHLGQARNVPILRGGTIAAMPEEEIRTEYGHHKAYLIELRSIDGLSGSPVFAATSMMRAGPGKLDQASHLKFKFIGALLGHDEIMNRKDQIGIKPDGGFIEEGVRTLLNTGIGIVAHAGLVLETVKHPEMEAGRKRHISDAAKERRFVADSAARPEPSTKADNPQHKEDFNRLLGAAMQ